MVQQSFAPDGGIVSEPYRHYQEHRETYEYISERLRGTRQAYLGADAHTRHRLLFNSATYALLTAQTPLPRADAAFREYRDDPNLPVGALADRFSSVGIGFHNSKAEYIDQNRDRFDVFVDADDALRSGDFVDAQDRLMDLSGVGPAKSAFALATLGFTQFACADSHICRYFDIDPRQYDKYSADEYMTLIRDAFKNVPNLVTETSTFVAQWVTWDVARGGDGSNAPAESQGQIETHDTWFSHVARITAERVDG